MTCSYVDDKHDGKLTWFDTKGKITGVEIYKEGNKSSSEKYKNGLRLDTTVYETEGDFKGKKKSYMVYQADGKTIRLEEGYAEGKWVSSSSYNKGIMYRKSHIRNNQNIAYERFDKRGKFEYGVIGKGKKEKNKRKFEKALKKLLNIQ